mgnify:CR=1 FL=1
MAIGFANYFGARDGKLTANLPAQRNSDTQRFSAAMLPPPSPRKRSRAPGQTMLIGVEPKTMRFIASFSILLVVGCSADRGLSPSADSLEPVSAPAVDVPERELTSPVDLATAVHTLPADAMAGMPPSGRSKLLRKRIGDIDEEERGLHYFSDSSEGDVGAWSMLYLKLFEDEQGRTVAASHSARPFADGRDPDPANTVIYRVMDGRWVDVTDQLLPKAVDRSYYFKFFSRDRRIAVGPYVKRKRRDGLGDYYSFGDPAIHLRWNGERFSVVR